MSLSSRSGLRQKSSALLLNGLSSSTPAPNHKSLALNSTLDGTSINVISTPSANRSTVFEDDPCPWEDETTHFSTNPNISNLLPSTTPNTSSNLPTSSSTINGPNTIESLKFIAQKRITTFVYLKKVHEGKVHWFNTILLTRLELEKWFDQQRMQHRTTRFAVLGMSLSSVLDITTQQDFLRGLLNLLLEYETIHEDNFKPKMKGMFRNSKTPRKSATASDYPIGLQESGDTSYLITPNIPFDLDYFEVWITLCDILVEIYQKIIGFLGNSSIKSPASLNPPTFNNLGAPLPPSRPLSYSTNMSGSGHSNGGTNSDESLGPQAIEMINKIDGKLKKLIVAITKEIDGIARAAIREELVQLDPMLSILGGGPWD
ncbi:hypothetical protein CROQUDRAFT_653319 [Cronartium quercuum f. sp. fusiforme G11]|uniref:Uncharacterized protein n=1 Tax=Cronartium quercuum f. sp. fusiforme G11 TaxID=708437 RepID=A0A9P6TGG7_9BASI|nr:hypothetical protein CROQUDRAFT_653319 [Cronartium quercuum f. sp. fusiforme G11]